MTAHRKLSIEYLKTESKFSMVQLLIVAILFAAIGSYAIFRSKATPLVGDINNDGVVNITDLSILLSDYNTNNPVADLNSDGTVNILDLSILLSHYGETASLSWEWNASSAPLDPNSTVLVQAFVSYAIVSPNMALNNWAVATADARSGDPSYSVSLTDGGSLDSTVRIPLGTRPDPSGDGHLTVRDVGMGREHDFWQAHYDSATQRISSASAGVSFPLGAVNEQTTGWGGDAANVPLRRGLVTPEEIGAGSINHALVFAIPAVGSGAPRYPALHNTATCGSSCTNHLVEGAWMRLNPAVNCSSYGLPAWQVTICTALKNYGMFLRDSGSTLSLYGENPINRGGATLWSNVGLSGNSASFSSNFPWTSLQVLNPPSQ